MIVLTPIEGDAQAEEGPGWAAVSCQTVDRNYSTKMVFLQSTPRLTLLSGRPRKVDSEKKTKASSPSAI